MTTSPVLPAAEALDPSGDDSRPLRVTIVKTGEWPEPATLLGWAADWETAAAARGFWEQTGRQPVLPGYVPAGEW